MSTMATSELVLTLYEGSMNVYIGRAEHVKKRLHNFHSGSSVDGISTSDFCNKDIENKSFGHNFA